MIGFADHILLYFIKLVNAEDALRIFTVGTGLLAKTRAESNKGQRQVFTFENFVLVHTCNRDFSSANEEYIFAIDFIHLIAPFGELPATEKAEIACHRRDDQ